MTDQDQYEADFKTVDRSVILNSMSSKGQHSPLEAHWLLGLGDCGSNPGGEKNHPSDRFKRESTYMSDGAF